ncbi:MAG: 1-acyl-sn-glycerol-3-phosphate acyltransferase [Thermodesulfobacteriota bacterium]
MNLIKKILKGAGFFLLVTLFFIISTIADLIVRDRKKKLITFSKITSFCAKITLIILGIRVNKINWDKYINSEHNYMIVSNHLSYVDIFVIYSALPAVFIANSELKEEFPLGAITAYAGGIFVERRNRSKLLSDMKNISEVLEMAIPTVLFPEATTSDGEGLLAFKAPFLKSAINTQTNVLPICLNYRKLNGEPITRKNKDLVFFCEDLSFFAHFFRLLTVNNIDVDVEALEEIEVNSKMTRKELSQITYDRISESYEKIDA